MSNKTELLALAERCEAAEGPSAAERQLVIDAFYSVFPSELSIPEGERGDERTRYARIMRGARFTDYINTHYQQASLDAAMMLVPPRPWRVCTLSDYPSENFQRNSG